LRVCAAANVWLSYQTWKTFVAAVGSHISMSTSALVVVALVTASVICVVPPAGSDAGESVPLEVKLGAGVAVGAGVDVGAVVGAGVGSGAPATPGRRITLNACQFGDVEVSVALAATKPAGVMSRVELRMNELPAVALRAV